MSGKGFVDYSENTQTDTQIHRGGYRVRPGLKTVNSLVFTKPPNHFTFFLVKFVLL